MTQSLSAADILRDIEFELVQGALTRDDLGQGIQAVRLYQNRLRHKVFQSGREMPPLRELIARQFQLNDMLITLLQETAAAMQETQLRQKRLAQWQPASAHPLTAAIPFPNEDNWRDEAELQAALNEPLTIKMEIRPGRLPLIGTWIQRLKHEVHSLVLFYLRKLGDKQAAINQIYGQWALYFHTLHQQQQREIHQLQAQLAELQAQLNQQKSNSEQR